MVARRMRQQDRLCIICEQPLGNDVCIDHIWPRAHGGRNVWENKALTHTACNRTKGEELPSRDLLRRFKRWTGTRACKPKALLEP